MGIRYFIIFGLFLACISSANAGELNALSLLKRDLGESIEVHPKNEIWYCPDSTCEIYKAAKPSQDFPAFVYLHLFYESDYYYLGNQVGDNKAFRQVATEEPEVRAKVTSYCPNVTKSPSCILENMKKKLGIKMCWGRYDEGYFCHGCSENENICKKL